LDGGRGERGSGNWVKVFGFDDSYLNRVLEYFQRFGQITHYSKGKGNWVFLEYLSRVEAQSACKMNGKPIEDKVVIGVILPDAKSEVAENTKIKISTQNPKFDSRELEPVRYNSWAFKLGEYFFGAC
jgi:MPPN (rrm-like) domain.